MMDGPGRWPWLFAVMGASAFFAGQSCTVDAIDYTGKQCPCVEGYVCDEVTNTCKPPSHYVPPDASQDAAKDVAGDAPNDVSSDATDGGPPSPLGRACIGPAWSSGASANRKRVGRYLQLEEQTFDRLVAYLDGKNSSSGKQVARGVIYRSSASTGEPDALVAFTEEVSVAGGAAPAWVDMPFTSSVKLAPGEYWLGIHTGAGSAIRYSIEAIDGASRIGDDSYADGPSDPFGATSLLAAVISIYAHPVGVSVDDSQKCVTGTGGSGGSGGTGGTAATGGTGGTSNGGTGGATGGTGGATGGSGGTTGGTGGTGGATGGTGGSTGGSGGTSGTDGGTDGGTGGTAGTGGKPADAATE